MVSDTTKTKFVRRRKSAKKGKQRKKEAEKRGTINYLTVKELPLE